MKFKRGRAFLLLLTFGFLLPLGVGAQEVEEEEAPESLFSLELGDKAMEVFFEGYWLSRLSFGTGFLSDLGGIQWGRTPQSIENGLIFQQVPNFTLSLWYDQRYYFETSYIGGFDKNTFALGFQALEEEWGLQRFRLGNKDISVDTYAGQSSPAGKDGTPGVVVRTATPDSQQEYMLRYQKGGKERKSFLGYREEETVFLSPGDFLKGRFFTVEDSPPFSNLEVQLQDGTLPPRTPKAEEVLVDAEQGRIYLLKPYWGKVLARWEGSPVTPNTWTTLSDQQNWSPLAWERMNLYPLPAQFSSLEWDLVPEVVKAGSEEVQDDYRTIVQTETGTLEVQRVGVANGDRYPFNLENPELYDASYRSQEALFTSRIRLRYLRKTASLTLGPSVVPQSVTVWRNGRPAPEAKIDPGTGQITFPYPLMETDRIEAEFQKESSTSDNSQLLFVQGNRWKWSEKGLMETWFSGQWTFDQDSFTTEPDSALGGARASVRVSDQWDKGGWSAQFTGGLTLPDTTGTLKAIRLEGEGFTPIISSYTLRPSPPPPDPLPTLETLTVYNRGRLLYTDFWSLDPLGQRFLSPYDSPKTPEPSTTTTGPSFAGPSEGLEGRVMVLDYLMEGGEEWVGAQLALSPPGPLDLRTVSKIRFKAKHLGATPPRLYLQAGLLSEDLDGGGQVQPVETTPRRGIPFLDQGDGRYQELTFPIEDGVEWGNDPMDKGFLFQEDPDRSWSREITLAASSDWQTLEVNLTPDESARLSSVNAWRILVLKDGAPDQTGRLLLAEWEAEGSSFVPNSTGTPPSLREDGGSKTLEIAYPDPDPAQELWSVTRNTASISPGAYKTLVLSYKSNHPGAEYQFSWLDSEGKGLNYRWIASGDAQWKEVRINMADSTVSHDGSPSDVLTIDSTQGSWVRTEWALTDNPIPGGGLPFPELEVGEPLLTDPIAQWNGLAVLSGNWDWSEPQRARELSVQTSYDGSEVWSTLRTHFSESLFQNHIEAQGGFRQNQGWWTLLYDYRLGTQEIWMEERYSALKFREELGAVNLGSWWGLHKISSKVFTRDTRLDQNWDYSWTGLNQKGTLQLSAAQFRQDSAFVVRDEGDHWLKSWQEILPTSSGGWYQLGGNLNFKFRDPTPPVGWDVEGASTGTLNRTTSSFLGTARWKFSLPLIFQEQNQGAWKLTPTLERNLQWSQTAEEGHWPLLTETWGLSLVELSPLLLAWPLEEIGDEGTFLEAGVGRGTLSRTSKAALSLSRPLFLNPWDLIVPGNLNASLSGSQNQGAQGGVGSQNFFLSLEQLAVNLFGSQGSHPWLDFITTDDYRWRFSLDHQATNLETKTTYSLGGRLAWEFLKIGKWSLEPLAQWSQGPNPTDLWSLQSALILPQKMTWPRGTPRWLVPKPQDSQVLHHFYFHWSQSFLPAFFVRLGQEYRLEILLSKQSTLMTYLKLAEEFMGVPWSLGLEAGLEVKISL